MTDMSVCVTAINALTMTVGALTQNASSSAGMHALVHTRSLSTRDTIQVPRSSLTAFVDQVTRMQLAAHGATQVCVETAKRLGSEIQTMQNIKDTVERML